MPHLFTLNNLSELVICPRLKNDDGAQSVDDVGNLEMMEATIIEQFIELPPGKLTKNYGKIHHFSWENSRNQWPFSIAMLNYQRVPSWKRIGTLPFFCTFEMLKFDQMRTPTNAQPCQSKPIHGRTQKGQVLYVHSPQESHKLVGLKKNRTLLPPP